MMDKRKTGVVIMEWKDGVRCAVCLTFDLDADISWRNILKRNKIERDNPVVLSLGKYGPKAAVPRILRLLDKHDVTAGFYIPGEVAEYYPESVKEIASQSHEIGHHGYSHRNPASLTVEEEREELVKGFEALEGLVNKQPQGYRAPAANMSENTYSLLAEQGLLYDSTMMGDDLPYIVEVGKQKIVELPFKWILDDWAFFGFNYFPPLEYQSGISSHRKVFEIWSDEFEAVYEEGLYMMLVMHPQIMGIPSRAKMLENLILQMKAKGDVWFATPIEIAQFWLEKEK
ncbi:MAG: polysaccharide deacetylase family protein [Candidatus Thorarchaeota archaeon]|jgi:peptidoglycan/xylan/chitin deacetylase (PgdA/CDA1 family)